jgi:hypothetical protein
MPSEYPSSELNALGEVLSEEAFGVIKTLTRLAHTNPSVSIDRMNDYQVVHHEISDTQCISFVRMKLCLGTERF